MGTQFKYEVWALNSSDVMQLYVETDNFSDANEAKNNFDAGILGIDAQAHIRINY